MTTTERVHRIVRDHFGIEPADDDRFTDIDADSLDMLELAMAVEEEFGIDVPDDALDDMATIGDVVRYVETRV